MKKSAYMSQVFDTYIETINVDSRWKRVMDRAKLVAETYWVHMVLVAFFASMSAISLAVLYQAAYVATVVR